jgi:hypothetical protein
LCDLEAEDRIWSPNANNPWREDMGYENPSKSKSPEKSSANNAVPLRPSAVKQLGKLALAGGKK